MVIVPPPVTATLPASPPRLAAGTGSSPLHRLIVAADALRIAPNALLPLIVIAELRLRYILTILGGFTGLLTNPL